MSILSLLSLGYGIYHAVTWLVVVSCIMFLLDGVLGLFFSIGPAIAGMNKRPTKTELREFEVLLYFGFGNTLIILVMIGWFIYINS